MPDLIAQGTEPRHRWRRPLIAHVPITLGRSAGTWDVPWDQQISRQHAQLIWNGDALVVTRIPTAHNPMFVRGEQCDQCELRLGEHFVIGTTTFSLVDQKIDVLGGERPSVSEQAFTSTYLQDLRYRDADHRIEVLSRLPELIQSAASDQELFVRLVSFLLAGIPRADTAAVVAVNSAATSSDPVRVMYWDSQRNGAPTIPPQQPSDLLGREFRSECPHNLARQTASRGSGLHTAGRRGLGILYARIGRSVSRLGHLRDWPPGAGTGHVAGELQPG